ncbi:hypothetical protein P0Y31_14750 [Knoellia sp. 3-2P3]|uniref:hypothetical protein n=1 Tax=unclassified Knoellia TaxID=2618719 RepID=UPI0023DAAD32|nr:hypothetical protein [Knoellia sp. 3-2P3]MDF2093610.1 hypothetical protein [Knoellia sp. 3-2P3]
MEPMKPLQEAASPPVGSWRPSRRRAAMEVALSAGWIALATAFLHRDGFSWLAVLTLIVAAINLGSWLGDVRGRREGSTSP